MHRHRSLIWCLTMAITAAVVYSGWQIYRPHQLLPFFTLADAHTAVVRTEGGAPLPPPLRPDDRIDLRALEPGARIALIKSANLNLLPDGSTYALTVQHPGAENAPSAVTVQTSAADPRSVVQRFMVWGLFSFLTYPFCLSIIALLALWKGRGRDAMGLALWASAFLIGVSLQFVPSDGAFGLAVLLASNILFLLARIGFYTMAEAMAASDLTPRAITGWRTAFSVLMAFGAAQSLGGTLAFVAFGWGELSRPAYGVALTMSYAVPVAMLMAALSQAGDARRLRLRWVASCGVVYVAAIFLINTPILGPVVSLIVARAMFSLSMVGLLYGVLRARLLDFRVVLNRTLVYAATTSLVLGLFSLCESLIERVALGERASLVLELLVPLALGASLTAVHRRIDALAERLVFRRQYLQERELRRFAREAAFVSSPESLMGLAVAELQRQTGAPWVALYESSPSGLLMARQVGEHALPARLDPDDPAVVAFRARELEVDLLDRAGALAADGYAFPLQVRGHLAGLLVIGSRPDERYSREERELFAHVAHEVGAALFAIRAQISEQQLSESRVREAALLDALRAKGEALPG